MQIHILFLAVSLTFAAAAPQYPVAPVYHAAPAYKEPVEPAVYNYNYAVKDDYSGVNFQATETREGGPTAGSYSVALPDGRTQTVTYNVADGYTGFVADVQYAGEATYAETPAYKPAPPAYKPAPVVAYKLAPVVYKPAPVAYKPAPVVAYKPAPVAYKPAPVVYKPAPVVYKPAPV